MATKHRPTGEAERIETLKQKALQLRIEGHSYRAIGKRLKVSYVTAHRYVTTALDEIRKETDEMAEQVKTIELRRLDEAQNVIAGILKNRRTKMSTKLAALDRLVKIQERRAKYLGLDAPTKTALTDPSGEHDSLAQLKQLPDSVLMTLAGGAIADGDSDPED